jgi:hypothetical protein
VGKNITYTLDGQTKTGKVDKVAFTCKVDKVAFGKDGIGLYVNNDVITTSQVTELRASN